MIGFALALALMMLPLQWVLAILIAAAFHEFCHFLAVRLCGGQMVGLKLTPHGAQMEVEGLSQWQELICSLAGPVGGFMLLPFLRYIPMIAICAVCQSLFNLIPVYPLDGGRALRCLLQWCIPRQADCICLWVRRIALTGIGCLGLYGTLILKLGILPLAMSVLIFAKIACNAQPH